MRELASGVIDESFGGWHGQELGQAVAWIIFLSGYRMDETFGKPQHLIRASLGGMNNTVVGESDEQYLRWETGWMVPSLGGGIDNTFFWGPHK